MPFTCIKQYQIKIKEQLKATFLSIRITDTANSIITTNWSFFQCFVALSSDKGAAISL